eukprot:1504906-Pleurochrysis_carterae.AAC.1
MPGRDVYCGAGRYGRGRPVGDERQCASHIRLYGVRKVPDVVRKSLMLPLGTPPRTKTSTYCGARERGAKGKGYAFLNKCDSQ